MNQTDTDTITAELHKLLADIKELEEMFTPALKSRSGRNWGRGFDKGAQSAFRKSHRLISRCLYRISKSL